MNWFIAALTKYADFSGRARRSEYWYFLLFYILIDIGLTIIDEVTGAFSFGRHMGLLSGLFGLAMFIPMFSVAVRRLHDTNRSGWLLLLGLIPLIGTIILLVFMVQDSHQGENRFGPNPKEVA